MRKDREPVAAIEGPIQIDELTRKMMENGAEPYNVTYPLIAKTVPMCTVESIGHVSSGYIQPAQGKVTGQQTF